MADATTFYFVDPNGLAHYHGTQVKPTIDKVNTISGYFDGNGAANNANQLGGHGADYFASSAALNGVLNGLQWKNSVADAEALKAIAKPTEGMTVSLDDTNQIYRFDATNKATADADDASLYVPADKTAGAWLKVGSAVYGPATEQVDGLMTAADKKALNGIQDKVNGLSNTAGVFFASVDIGSDSDVNQSDITIPDGITIKVGDSVIDNQGGQYQVTSVTPASGSGDNAVPAKVHCGPVGLQLALKSAVDSKVDKVDGKGLSSNDFTADYKSKLEGLNNYTLPTASATVLGGVKIGNGIQVAEDGTVSVSIPQGQNVQAATNDMIDAAFKA